MSSRIVGARGATAPEPEAVADWVLERRSARVGPLSIFELALAAKSGLVEPGDLIWRPGLPRWFAAGEVPGLLPPSLPSSPRGRSGYGTAASPDQPRPAVVPVVPIVQARPPPTARAASRPTAGPSLPVPPAARRREPFARPVARIPEPPPASPAMLHTLAEALAPTTVSLPPVSTAQWIADAIARKVVVVLELQNIRTLDDLASDERLQGIATAVIDALPMAIRLPISQTIGRRFIEGRIVDLLRSYRAKWPPETRTADLSRLILEQAPVIAQRIDEHMASASRSAREALAGAWGSTVDALRSLGPGGRRPLPEAPA